MNKQTKAFEKIEFPHWACCSQELGQFIVNDLHPLDVKFRAMLSELNNALTDKYLTESISIAVAKLMVILKELEENLDMRDKAVYKAVENYMSMMFKVSCELCNEIEKVHSTWQS